LLARLPKVVTILLLLGSAALMCVYAAQFAAGYSGLI
jgi:hypothetical protein